MQITPKILIKNKIDLNLINVEVRNNYLQFDKEFNEFSKKYWEQFQKEAHKKGLKPWDGTFYRMIDPTEFVADQTKLKLNFVKFSQIIAGRDYEIEFKDSHHLNHIVTGSLIKTKDNIFVFGERGVSMSKSNFDFIGGGLQPEEIKVSNRVDITTNQIKEMKEKANLGLDEINLCDCIGLIKSKNMNCIFVFHIELNIDSEKVKKLFKDRKDDEMDDLKLVYESDLEKFLKSLSSFRPLVWDLCEEYKYKN